MCYYNTPAAGILHICNALLFMVDCTYVCVRQYDKRALSETIMQTHRHCDVFGGKWAGETEVGKRCSRHANYGDKSGVFILQQAQILLGIIIFATSHYVTPPYLKSSRFLKC